MDLTRILLNSITREEFARLHNQWYSGTNYKQAGGLQIEIPHITHSYEQLVTEFAEHPQATYLSVNNKGKWLRFSRESIKQDMGAIIHVATEDSIKKGHVELHFVSHFPTNCRIRYAETDKGIVGFEINLLRKNARLFAIGKEPSFSDTMLNALLDRTGYNMPIRISKTCVK